MYMNNNIYVFIGTLIVIISILISFFTFKFKQLEKDNMILNKKIKNLENNIEKFSDGDTVAGTTSSSSGTDKEDIKEMIIEEINKIYDIDVESIRNLGIISKSLLTGKNYHNYNDKEGVNSGTLVIPANVKIDGTLSVNNGPTIKGSKNKYTIGPENQCVEIHTPPKGEKTKVIIKNLDGGSELHLVGNIGDGNPQTSVFHKNTGSLYITGASANPAVAGLKVDINENVITQNNLEVMNNLVVNEKIEFGKDGTKPANIKSTNFKVTEKTFDLGTTTKYMDHFKCFLKEKDGRFMVFNKASGVMTINTSRDNSIGGDRIAFGRQAQHTATSSYVTPALEIYTRTGYGENHNLVILDNTALRENHLFMNAKNKDGWLNKMVTDDDERKKFNNSYWQGASDTGTLIHVPGSEARSIYWRQGLTMTNWATVKDNSWGST